MISEEEQVQILVRCIDSIKLNVAQLVGEPYAEDEVRISPTERDRICHRTIDHLDAVAICCPYHISVKLAIIPLIILKEFEHYGITKKGDDAFGDAWGLAISRPLEVCGDALYSEPSKG